WHQGKDKGKGKASARGKGYGKKGKLNEVAEGDEDDWWWSEDWDWSQDVSWEGSGYVAQAWDSQDWSMSSWDVSSQWQDSLWDQDGQEDTTVQSLVLSPLVGIGTDFQTGLLLQDDCNETDGEVENVCEIGLHSFFEHGSACVSSQPFDVSRMFMSDVVCSLSDMFTVADAHASQDVGSVPESFLEGVEGSFFSSGSAGCTFEDAGSLCWKGAEPYRSLQGAGAGVSSYGHVPEVGSGEVPKHDNLAKGLVSPICSRVKVLKHKRTFLDFEDTVSHDFQCRRFSPFFPLLTQLNESVEDNQWWLLDSGASVTVMAHRSCGMYASWVNPVQVDADLRAANGGNVDVVGSTDVRVWIQFLDEKSGRTYHKKASLRALVAKIQHNILSTTTMCGTGWSFWQNGGSQVELRHHHSGDRVASISMYAGCPWVRLTPERASGEKSDVDQNLCLSGMSGGFDASAQILNPMTNSPAAAL
ncbi:MAG: hypothetical protein AAGJ35_10835, partial [Myxococcota bacterium]